MRVYTSSAENHKVISQLLLRGEVVAIPTETVYGLAADALNPLAVEKIYQIKGRPVHNPLIIHVPTSQAAGRYVELNPAALKLIEEFWPGPLTLVLPKKPCIPAIVTAGLPTVGIRCPRHPAMHAILELIDRPLAAPSANPSNYISPTTVEHVVQHLHGRLQYALDGGPCEAGVESTIVDLSTPDRPRLLRPGPIPLSQIEQTLGQSVARHASTESHESSSTQSIITSPGQLKVHYSPSTALTLLRSPHLPASISSQSSSVAIIHFGTLPETFATANAASIETFQLSTPDNAKDAEKHLYRLLQQLDGKSYAHIYVMPLPEDDAWLTIRDRLGRAACK